MMSLGIYIPRGVSNISGGSLSPWTVSLNGGSVVEIGQTISSVNLSWSYNYGNVNPNTSQSLNQGIGSLGLGTRSYNYTTPFTTDTTFTINASDTIRGVCASSTSVNFKLKRYWGISSIRNIDNSTIISSDSDLISGIDKDITYDCSSIVYFWYAYPDALGPISSSTTINGLPWGDYYNGFDESNGNTSGYTINITNSFGNTSTYRMLMSYNIQTGSAITVKFKG